MALTFFAVFATSLAVMLVVFMLFVTHNTVVALQQRIDKAWTNIEVALKQRHDELPNLVVAVRDLMAYERGVLEEVTRWRSAYSPDDPIRRQAATAEGTSTALRTLFEVVENYPQIRSQPNVLDLQNELERLEGIIAARRDLYNDQVYRYNTTIRQVPAVLLAGFFGWRAREFFGPDPADTARPDVTLRAR